MLASRRDLPRIIVPQVTMDRSSIDVSSASFDSDLLGIGATPWNDASSSRIMVPETPTGSGLRYLARTAAMEIPQGVSRRIRGIRQAVGIGVLLQNDDDDNPQQYLLQIDQTSPFWHFTDGNISWHLRVIRGQANERGAAFGVGPGRGTDYETGTDTVLVVDPLDSPLPPAGGIPPGVPLGCLGTFRDLRYPWRAPSALSSLDIDVAGPAIIALYASIKQTDPETRQSLSALLPVGFNPAVLLPEDQFLIQCEQADPPLPCRFLYVSGSIVMETEQQYMRPGPDAIQAPSPT